MSDKTQCPSCGTLYPMPKDKLADPNVRANCGKCKKSFLLNKHLVQPNSPPPVAKAGNTTTQAKTSQTKSELVIGANDLDKSSDFSLPKVTIRPKKSPPLPADGMIFDDMDGEDDSDIDFGDDLDDFLDRPTIIQDTHQSSQDHNKITSSNEEAWLDDLLKDTRTDEQNKLLKQNPNDDLSDVLGVDLSQAIPEAVKTTPNKTKAPKRPTQEQLARRRSLGYYVGWSLACLALMGLLLGQYVFFNANTIAKHTKNAALVNALCLDCLPAANPRALMTDYKISQGQADYSTDLLGSISNISDQDQLYPNLKITILNAEGVQGVLALAPDDYLPFKGHHQLGAKQSGRFLLTLDVPYSHVEGVIIEPFY